MKTILLPFLILLLTQIAQSQGVVQQTANSVGLLYYQDKSIKGSVNLGTGTLISKPIIGKGSFIFIVTNQHVLPKKTQSDSIHFKIKGNENGFFDLRIKIFEKNGDYSQEVRIDPEGNDLALINISQQFNLNKDLDYLLKQMFSMSFLLSRDSIKKEVQIGDEVFFIGYPNALYDKRNISPIVRSGIIASDPSEDFYFNETYRGTYYSKSGELIPEKLTGFLIDANVFNGSSGSLVFTKPKLFKLEQGKLKYSTNPDMQVIVLGILTKSYFDITSLGSARLQLGGVISSEQIVKTMNLFVPK